MSDLITEIGKAGEELPDGFVRIQYRIVKLKAKKTGPPPEAKNADINITGDDFTQWGFSVIIRGHQKGDLSNKAYRPFIKKLPYEIVPKQCYFTVDDNFFYVWLKKKDENQSWLDHIKKDKLETDDSN